MKPNGLLIMGVSGSGKTSVGVALAHHLGWDFLDADDFHSPANIAKMAAGIPLTDTDRLPWLALLHHRLEATLRTGRHPVLACSALKKTYRRRLLDNLNGMQIIYLKGTYPLINSRMSRRDNHFMQPSMLKDQFEVLEEPTDAVVIDIDLPVDEIVSGVLHQCFGDDKLP
jgi:gluconokinase